MSSSYQQYNFDLKGITTSFSILFIKQSNKVTERVPPIATGDNTEKIWAHQFFAKHKTNMPKAREMAAGGLESTVSLPVGVRGQSL